MRFSRRRAATLLFGSKAGGMSESCQVADVPLGVISEEGGRASCRGLRTAVPGVIYSKEVMDRLATECVGDDGRGSGTNSVSLIQTPRGTLGLARASAALGRYWLTLTPSGNPGCEKAFLVRVAVLVDVAVGAVGARPASSQNPHPTDPRSPPPMPL